MHLVKELLADLCSLIVEIEVVVHELDSGSDPGVIFLGNALILCQCHICGCEGRHRLVNLPLPLSFEDSLLQFIPVDVVLSGILIVDGSDQVLPLWCIFVDHLTD